MQMSMSNQKNIDASIKNLETQVGQIVKQLEDQQEGTFTTTTQRNSKEHCKSITIRSGGVLELEVDENEKKERRVVEVREKQERKREEEEKEEGKNKKRMN